MRRLLTAVLPSFLLLGCSTHRAEWREFETPVVPFEEIWRTVLEKAQLSGFVSQIAGDEATDRGLKEFHSRWITREYGFRNTMRRRMHAAFEPSETTPGAWRVKLRIEREIVSDMAKSMKPEDRDWKSDGQDTDTEDRILAQVKMQLGMTALTPRQRGR